MSLLIMVGIWTAMLLCAWLWGKATKFHSHSLETWAFNPAEAVLWRDDRADIEVVPTMGRPAILRPLRLHRWRAVATTERILVATKELFSGRHRVLYVLYPGAAPAAEDTGNTGGYFKTGYRTLVIRPGSATVHADKRSKLSYIGFRPDPAVLSSLFCAEFRIYTELYESFPKSTYEDAGRGKSLPM